MSGITTGKLPVFLFNDSLGTGGTERQFAFLARSLNRDRFTVEVGCLRKEGAFLRDVGEIIEFRQGSFYSLRAWLARAGLARYLRNRSFKIAHSFDWYSNMALIPMARLACVPAIVGSYRQLGYGLSKAQVDAQKTVFRMCRRIVCNSQAAAGQLCDRGVPARKLLVVGNAIPAAAFASVCPALAPVPGLLRVGMVARMNEPVKNYPMLLRAAARLLAKRQDLEFVLVGDGEMRADLEALARELGIDAKVRFMGERYDIAAMLASFDISVSCSTSESLSNSIIEAMAAARPVVATRVGGTPELVQPGHTGILVASDDDAGMAEALQFLLERPGLRSEWGANGRRYAQQHFNMESVCGQYEELYLTLLQRKGSGGRGPVSAEGKASTVSARAAAGGAPSMT